MINDLLGLHGALGGSIHPLGRSSGRLDSQQQRLYDQLTRSQASARGLGLAGLADRSLFCQDLYKKPTSKPANPFSDPKLKSQLEVKLELRQIVHNGIFNYMNEITQEARG